MARMIADRDSTEVHLNTTRRHQRLARRYRLDSLVTAIQPAITTLESASGKAAERELDRQAAYDELLAADADLDDGVRNLYNTAEIYDREHPGAGVLTTLFPEGGFTSITEESIAAEPDVADALAARVESLGSSHALAPHAAKLRQLTAAVRQAITDQETAIRNAKAADAEEEIAQAALRRQYEVNYLDARRNTGRPLCERIFPGRPAIPAKTPVVPTPAAPAQ